MWLGYEMAGGRVGGDGRQGHDQIAQLHIRLEATAGADAHQALDPELCKLLDDDRRRRAAHAGRLHGDRLAVERPRIAEHASLGIALNGPFEKVLRDVLRAKRIARQQAGLGVITGLGSDVDGHGAEA